MDDRRPLRSVHHYYFEQVSGPVGTEDEVAGRVRGHLLNYHGVAYGVLGVLQFDAVAERRPEGIHRGIVLQNRALFASLVATLFVFRSGSSAWWTSEMVSLVSGGTLVNLRFGSRRRV